MYIICVEFMNIFYILDLGRLANHIFKVFDADDTGYISLRRLLMVVIALSSGDAEENVEKIFYLVDLNNDGVISQEVRSNCNFLNCQYYF